jgi:predicted RNA-binding Zn-ribbon protein involved in translation (DUF1610 family)
VNGGDNWTEDINISKYAEKNPANAGMVSMLITQQDNIYVVWKCSNYSYIEEKAGWYRTSNDIYYSTSNNGGDNWEDPVRLTHAEKESRICPKMMMDANNIIHLVWGDNRPNHSDNMEIYYKRSLYPLSEKPIAVTLSPNQTTCKPGNAVIVSGNAVYNDSIVPNANVIIKILETDDDWNTTTDSNGDYSKNITAPTTPGNYTIRVTVISGNHTGWKQMRLTVEQESPNGGQQSNGEENKQKFDFNYVLMIVVVIAVCIIVGVFLVKRREKTTAKTEKKKVEKPTIKLRCPKCRQTFTVEEKTKPFSVKCPNCGKEGTIK